MFQTKNFPIIRKLSVPLQLFLTLNQMETLIGLELCISGTAEKVTADGQCVVHQGVMIIRSPMFPMLEISRTADYRSVLLQDKLENIYSLFAQHLPSAEHLYVIKPHILLTTEQQRLFLQSVQRIQEKEQQLQQLQHPVRQKLLSTIIDLLRKQTLLEFAFLFSEQLLSQPQAIPPKRQVLMSFLLTLNQHYHEQRSVAYYAQQQGLTPRHFADIIKQQSDLTPMQWINLVIINHAKQLLSQPDILVKQVADELGFPEQFTFRKYFKHHTGMSPTEYISLCKTTTPLTPNFTNT